MTLLVLHKKTTADTNRRNITLDDIQITLNYNVHRNLEGGDYLVHTRREDNLPAHIRGKAIYHEWEFTPANSYKVVFGGKALECEFINRHWYWITWNSKWDNGKGAYTFNPAYDYIITPKEYELGTKEDHYHEPKSEENLDEGDESSKETESSKDTDSSKGKGKECTPVASSPIERLAKSLGEYIATKETQQIVQATQQLSLAPPVITMATAMIVRAGRSGQVQQAPKQPAPQQPQLLMEVVKVEEVEEAAEAVEADQHLLQAVQPLNKQQHP